ncbi:N-6 DNA methylase [Bosea sp. (in: a-proteobacteria)]|uniref:N-6 DNA methylase n=1 Tax=Bosea sp. (in: a-proteobacteria) TaxID=1871050 RepID=UPI004034BB4C
MVTGELRSKIDAVWNAFWAGGIANPLEVIEQITYLLFMRGLDEAHTREENKANRLGRPMERRIFPSGKDGIGKDGGVAFEDLRWSRLKNQAPAQMFMLVSEHVFPFLRSMAEDDSAHATHMKGARFTIPTPALLAKVVDLLAEIPMEDRDTKGDLYEYMLSKIASAGQNGQFRTPRHIIALMVKMAAPGPKDIIVDPACGTCGFLVAAGEYLRDNHPRLFQEPESRDHFHQEMFHGFDFDGTMLRIGSMNMVLHGVDSPDIRYKDSLAHEHGGDADRYSLVLANPPFAGSLDYETTAKDLLSVVKTKKTELLFMALFLKLLKPGGRAVVIVPNGILENDGSAYDTIRRSIVNDCKLEAVIALPHWTFKPYASVATSILLFRKSGVTTETLFFRLENDGFSSGAERKPQEGSEIDVILDSIERLRLGELARTPGKIEIISKKEIIDNDYDLAPAVYLSGYHLPEGMNIERIGDLFDVFKGNVAASESVEGQYKFFTTSSQPKTHDQYKWDSEAIIIPTVSATGHGHASIRNVHYVNGKFSSATITAVLVPKKDRIHDIFVPYVHAYLASHKDDVLVPQMRGAANVSLSLDRIKNIRIPLPGSSAQQEISLGSIAEKRRAISMCEVNLKGLKLDLDQEIANFRKRF